MDLGYVAKKLTLSVVTALLFHSGFAWCQGPFDPTRNAELDLRTGMRQAKQEHKNILLDFGANWCAPCVSLDQLLEGEPDLKRLLAKGFVLIRVSVGIDKDSGSTRAVRRMYPPFTLVPHLLVLAPDGSLLTEQKVTTLMKDPAALDWDRKRLALFLEKCGAPRICKSGL